ncbi:hypothetical protein [Chthoniobacter flavus]|uniref:hypothetical protein n=1 Tax=Chthoniobacter flavus TaxID=191863 RepID=UPI001047932A|nr:hypothetical protein [Chthoniobacter flavus]
MGALIGFVFVKHAFDVAIEGHAVRDVAVSKFWETQEFSGILVDLPIRLKADSHFDPLNPALASLYSDFSNASGSAGDTEIRVTSMVEARSDLAGLAETAEFTAKSFASKSYVVHESHSIEDWKQGSLSGKLVRLQARLRTQDFSVHALLIKQGSRRWTIYTSYHPSLGSAIADRIIASVRPAQ